MAPVTLKIGPERRLSWYRQEIRKLPIFATPDEADLTCSGRELKGIKTELTKLSTSYLRLFARRRAELSGVPPRRSQASGRALILALFVGLTACTSWPPVPALRPDFDVMTPAGLASVSIRQAPYGMTDAQFADAVRTGMEQTAPGSIVAGSVEPPFPSQRIVWHAHTTASRGTTDLIVNIFNGWTPYAYEEGTIVNDAPSAVVSSTIGLLSKQLLAAIAARSDVTSRADAQT
jgi:hypothetical protein